MRPDQQYANAPTNANAASNNNNGASRQSGAFGGERTAA